MLSRKSRLLLNENDYKVGDDNLDLNIQKWVYLLILERRLDYSNWIKLIYYCKPLLTHIWRLNLSIDDGLWPYSLICRSERRIWGNHHMPKHSLLFWPTYEGWTSQSMMDSDHTVWHTDPKAGSETISICPSILHVSLPIFLYNSNNTFAIIKVACKEAI